MNVQKIRAMLTVLSVVFLLLSFPCYAQSGGTPLNSRLHLRIVSINSKKISAHEHYVMRAQERYRYIKPLLTACGITFVVSYIWYTSSSFSDEEMNKIRNMIEQKDAAHKDWFKFGVSSIGGLAVELIGGALIIPPLSDLIGKVTGSAHIMSSLELYDKEYTHCHALITQMARDMQLSLSSQATGTQVTIGAFEVVHATNRLVQRIEKLIGFMRVLLKNFPSISLRQEAYAIEKRLVNYTNELCNDMQMLVDNPTLDFQAVLELVIPFAQRYAQEIERFRFLEQDARDGG